jgi:hypothetical protein
MFHPWPVVNFRLSIYLTHLQHLGHRDLAELQACRPYSMHTTYFSVEMRQQRA